MGRCRSRTHYNELRRYDIGALQKTAFAPAARWRSEVTWSDGSSIDVEKAEDACLRFAYSIGDQDVSQYVPLVFAPRHYGGAQAYLLCPRCDLRCRILRLRGGAFRCRRCMRAIYRSQSYDAAGRALNRFRKLRALVRAGTEDAGLDYFPRRPKRMRRATYAKVKSAALAALDRYDASLDAGLFRLLARIAPQELAAFIEG